MSSVIVVFDALLLVIFSTLVPCLPAVCFLAVAGWPFGCVDGIIIQESPFIYRSVESRCSAGVSDGGRINLCTLMYRNPH